MLSRYVKRECIGRLLFTRRHTVINLVLLINFILSFNFDINKFFSLWCSVGQMHFVATTSYIQLTFKKKCNNDLIIIV